jgi:predicted HTH domain antitoxin
MANISIDIPNDLLVTLCEQPAELSYEVRFIAALHYFREKRLSLGQAARFAGLSRLDFLDIMAKRGIPAFDLSAEDATAEIAAAQREVSPNDRQ